MCMSLDTSLSVGPTLVEAALACQYEFENELRRKQEGQERPRRDPWPCMNDNGDAYFTCLLTSFVISNIVTVFLPPKTAFNLSSALMLVLFFLSCRPFFLM